ncbi:MAG: GDSL-type esterase/lipase family protein [Planctomycetota bacterium]|nr:GDSL-type esterase/lipase family protein [Planctomycetota bacterium]
MPAALPIAEPVVFFGSSSVEMGTFILLFKRAFGDAGEPVPRCRNAGVGGDTVAKMLARFERDVLAHRPGTVVVYPGMNDAHQDVSPADFERGLETIVRRIVDAGAKVVMLTTGNLGQKLAEAQARVPALAEVCRTVARRFDLPLGDTNQLQLEAMAAGKTIRILDDIHPNWEGQRIMCRAVLDAIGRPDLKVLETMSFELMPGLIRTWRIRPVKTEELPLDAARIASERIDAKGDAWTPYRLPEPNPWDYYQREQLRQLGFAMRLGSYVAPSPAGFVGVATIESPKARSACLNTGADLRGIWVNGERLLDEPRPVLGEAGRLRLLVRLRAGANTVVIQSGDSFFLSVTDDDRW